MRIKKKECTFWRCIKMAFEILPGHFSWMLIIHIIVAILPLLGAQLSRKIYGLAQSLLNRSQSVMQIVFPLVLYTCYLLLMKAYVVYYQRVAIQFGGLPDFEKKAKLRLHKKCDQVDMRMYETPAFYNNLWEAKVASINVYRLVECSIGLVCIVLNIFLMSGYAFSIHPSFFLLAVLTAIPALVEKVFSAVLRNKRRSELTQLSKAERLQRKSLTEIPCAKERLVYGSFPFLFKKWKETADHLLDKDYALGKCILCMGVVLTIIKAASIASVHALAGWLFFNGEIDFADFMVTISTTLHLQSQYSDLFSDIGSFSEFQMMVKPYFQFIDTENKSPEINPTGNIKFNHVRFAYPTSDKDVLHSLNFCIHSGEKIAIVGVNGAGKTTLSKLLVRLLPPSSGTIEGQLASSYGVMFQDFQKYELTLRENIALNEYTPSMPSKIDQLIDEINMRDIPDYVLLGREFGGTDLSGGQWQKTALARLFYHDGELLVLDEPTSAIDPIYEKNLNELILGKVGRGKTLIVISHRLSIAKLVDRVFVLENGTIVEQGNHERLIQNPNSRYTKLWTAQIGWYK